MLRVVGPPGTGKTAYLRQQVEAWSGQYDPRDMVLTSFTRAAARVLTGRVAVPAGNIATLHALCYRHMGPLPIAETGALAKEWDESGIPTAWRIGEGGEEIDPEERVLYDEPAGTMLADLNLWRAWGRPPHPLEEKRAPSPPRGMSTKSATEPSILPTCSIMASSAWTPRRASPASSWSTRPRTCLPSSGR